MHVWHGRLGVPTFGARIAQLPAAWQIHELHTGFRRQYYYRKREGLDETNS